jgi:N-acetylmuramoyl-L-alanine amidase
MKRILLYITLLLEFTFAQNFTGIKIYINPGHGGYDSNDRNIPQTGFWESESNLHKGLKLRDILQSWGATVVMSRVTNTSDDDKALSTIVAEANAANVDHMHSIHSNASNQLSNYTLVLFQGTDDSPTYPDAKTMSNYLSDDIYSVNRTTAKYSRGDMSFYGTTTPYLGVFKGLNMPGTLSEGSFHDYIPESWRLMSILYKKHEAIAIARSFIKKFNKTPFPLGVIAGIVRTKDSSSNHLNAFGNDVYKPLNNVKVTLKGNNVTRVLYTDNLNNGFYLFDSLQPGTYKVYFEKYYYFKDSSTVTVNANSTTFADKFLALDGSIPAVLSSYSPNISANDSVYITANIVLNFSRPIDKTTLESGFTITPQIQGTFTWSNSDQTVKFTPINYFSPKTKYTVTIPTTVKSIYGVNLPQQYTFSFNVNSRTKFSLLSTYPDNQQKNIPHFVQVKLVFDAEILTSSIAGQFTFTDLNGKNINAKNVVYSKDNLGRGIMVFEPYSSLIPGMIYKITLKNGIKDVNLIPLGETIERFFTVTTDTITPGTIVDGFENISNWKQPSLSSLSQNITNSSLVLDNSRKFQGSYSAKLNYEFTSSNSVCAIEAINKPNLGNGGYSAALIWGDMSNNIIQFIGENGSDILVSDTLNWAGWKYIKFNNNTNKDILLHSIIVKSNSNVTKGQINIDNLQKDVLVEIENKYNNVKTDKYYLFQNYPNPFNPITTISYNILKGCNVKIEIYNSLGELVKVLVNEYKPSGTYFVNFNADNLPSGTYFYRMVAGEYIKTNKMILLK